MRSIKVRLVTAFILLITIPLLLLGYFSIGQASSMIERDSAASRQTIIDNKGLTLEEVLRTVESLSTEIFTNQEAIGIASGEGFASEKQRDDARSNFQKRATSTTTGFSYVSSVAIFARNGQIHGDASVVNKSKDATPFTERDWYKAALASPGRIHWLGANAADFSMTASEGDEVISLVRTINKKATLTPVGVIKIDLDIGELIERVGLANTEQDSYALVDGEGRSVLGALQPGGGDWLGEVEAVSSEEEPAIEASSKIADVGGERNVLAYRPVEGTVWSLLSTTPLSALTREVQSIRLQTLLQIAIFAVIAGAAALLISLRLTRPIAKLSAAMKKVEGGDLNVRLVSSSKDEIGALTRSFNEMTGRLASLAEGVGQSNSALHSTVAAMMRDAETAQQSWQETTRSVQEIAIGASRQSETVQEGADIADGLAATIDRSVLRIGQASELAEEAHRYGGEGKEAISELTQAAARSTESVREVASRMRMLTEKSKEIDQIMKLIRDVAARTNILAMNASIEAARVGHSARGFHVIAGEIRELADQVKVSSNHIAGIVEELNRDTAQASGHTDSLLEEIELQDRLIGRNSQSFDRLLEAVDSIQASSVRLSEDAADMDAGNRSIVGHMHSISSVTQQTAAACEQVAASSEVQNEAFLRMFGQMADIRDQIAVLSASISRFRTDGQSNLDGGTL